MKYSVTRFLLLLGALIQSILASAIADASALPWANANPQAAAAAQAFADSYAEAVAIGHPDPEAYAYAASADDCASISCHAACGLLIIEGQNCADDGGFTGPYNTTCLCSEGSAFKQYYAPCMNCGWTLWKYYGGYVSSALAACSTLSTEPTGTLRCSTTLTDSYTIDTNIQGCSYLGNCETSTTTSSSSTTSTSSSTSTASTSSSTSTTSTSSSTSSSTTNNTPTTTSTSSSSSVYHAITHTVTTDLSFTYSYDPSSSTSNCFTTTYNFPVASNNPIDLNFIGWEDRLPDGTYKNYFFFNFTSDQTDVTDVEFYTESSYGKPYYITPTSEIWVNLKQGFFGYLSSPGRNLPAMGVGVVVTFNGEKYLYSYSCLTNRLTLKYLIIDKEDYDTCFRVGFWGFYDWAYCKDPNNASYATTVQFRPTDASGSTSLDISSSAISSSSELSSTASSSSEVASSSASTSSIASSSEISSSEGSSTAPSSAASSSEASVSSTESPAESSAISSAESSAESTEESSSAFSAESSTESVSSAESSTESSVESSIESSAEPSSSSAESSVESSAESSAESSVEPSSSSSEAASSSSAAVEPNFSGELVSGSLQWTLSIPGAIGAWTGISLEISNTTSNGAFTYEAPGVSIDGGAQITNGVSVTPSSTGFELSLDFSIDADQNVVIEFAGEIVSGFSFTSHASLVISLPDGRRVVKRADLTFELDSTITVDASSSASSDASSEASSAVSSAVSSGASSGASSAQVTDSSSSINELVTSADKVTAPATTVVTITSCSNNACSETAVTTGVTVVTETKSGIVTTYTTYCPITTDAEHTDAEHTTTNGGADTTTSAPGKDATTKTTEEDSPRTTVITITSCSANKCSESVVTSGVSTSVQTINGEASTVTAYVSLTTTVATHKSDATTTKNVVVTSTVKHGDEDKGTTGATDVTGATTTKGETHAPGSNTEVETQSTGTKAATTGSATTPGSSGSSTAEIVSTFEGSGSRVILGTGFLGLLLAFAF